MVVECKGLLCGQCSQRGTTGVPEDVVEGTVAAQSAQLLLATLAACPAVQTPAAMASRQAPLCGLAPCCLWLLGVVLLMDASARPANHSSARERAGNREENEILPPDHLNGVKLEMDGHLNKDFHQEVFLGKDMDDFEEDAEPRKSRRKLMVIFSKVDLNTDRRISAKEMQNWIMQKTAEHFQEAVAESRAHFRAVDPDGDGHVSWDEYKVKFLATKGHNEREVAEKIKNKWDLNIDEETQEVLENLKDRWYQADNPPPDLLLTESEFLSFLHPEHSRGMLQFMVKEIIRDLDQDGDKKLSLSEFISLPVGTVENQQGQDVDDGWVRDRKREFEELIDANHDGIVTMAELEDYMDPMNEFSALNEAKQMIAIADENQNHYLEPEEVLKYSEFFTGSKLVDYARSVHEEF
ncbi:45 kDa calcium-binding protein isoform X1 [Moschus berezovskii]|uniref:45 kDa calcium-binding protein isoform X1 n=2 Tax=Moschus berezovskii TaxID=68408 RepID=UPI00244532C4|nr:45 kDa calcium-binding protein isoform X1 [Moschus berezovskii]